MARGREGDAGRHQEYRTAGYGRGLDAGTSSGAGRELVEALRAGLEASLVELRRHGVLASELARTTGRASGIQETIDV